MEPAQTKHVETEVLSCDGGGGPPGHPRVFLNMEGKGRVDCPYCGCRYILEEGAGAASGH